MSRVSNSNSIFLQPVSVRDSIAKGVRSGAGRGRGVGRGRGASRGSNSGAGRSSTSGQASGAGKGSVSGQASGASRGSTNGAVVQNVGEKRTRESGSSRPSKLLVVGGKGK